MCMDPASAFSGAFGLIFGLIFFIVCLAIYFLPAIIASKRKHHNFLAIFVLTLLAGWTFLGWAIALIWSCTAAKSQIQI